MRVQTVMYLRERVEESGGWWEMGGVKREHPPSPQNICEHHLSVKIYKMQKNKQQLLAFSMFNFSLLHKNH